MAQSRLLGEVELVFVTWWSCGTFLIFPSEVKLGLTSNTGFAAWPKLWSLKIVGNAFVSISHESSDRTSDCGKLSERNTLESIVCQSQSFNLTAGLRNRIADKIPIPRGLYVACRGSSAAGRGYVTAISDMFLDCFIFKDE